MQMRVDVLETETLPEVRPYFPGTPLSPASTVSLPYPIVLAAKKQNDYFVPRESFNILAMFSNPMMMMMLVAGGLVLLMPTMMVRAINYSCTRRPATEGELTGVHLQKNMDPEVMEDFKERHAKMTNIQNSLQSGDIASG